MARELVQLHQNARDRSQWTQETSRCRSEIVADINAWARENLPCPGRSAHRHDETLGEVVDRLAIAAAAAFQLLMTGDVSGEHMHAAWTRLAELELEYSDLVRQVYDGQQYLPGM
ncbi:DUF4254 domain-containing protein [Nocardia mangyaensis]|uniref:DUF4254 domain-containing protein n=1 Tax=Nocardia mangyaensis TaxID=2213200 RepID=UPI002676FDF5|nr:DUF4254 domain-containing protein [Nocardia mangyaensis]MDO3648186.1 DUF4254 domain-containing protein [Nocardia mangyaensis]